HAYCGSTPASLTTPPQRSISESTNWPNLAPVKLGIALPLLAQSSLILGAFSAFTISSAILSTISAGVPAGAHIAYQVDTSYSGTPASATVGTSGKDGERSAEATANGWMEPARICEADEPRPSNATST